MPLQPDGRSGALEHKGAKIVSGHTRTYCRCCNGKGRGKEVIAVVRNADMIVLLVDVFNEKHVDVLFRELYDAGIRVNVPNLISLKDLRGGVRLNAVGTLDLDIEEVRSILTENRIASADILIRGNATQDDLIDAIMGSRVHPCNHRRQQGDLIDVNERKKIEEDLTERFGDKPIMICLQPGTWKN